MTFLADDAGVQTSRPVELYEFTNAVGAVTRYTSYHRDFVFGGNSYTARPGLKRGQFAIMSSQDVVEMTIEMPSSDPVVAAYCGVGIPPQRYQAHIVRVQQTSGTSESVFKGYISECSIDGFSAVFRVSQITGDGLAQSIPSVLASRLCQHVLYDSLCTIARGTNQVSPTISSIDATNPRLIVVSSIGAFSSSDFVFGDLLHASTGERRSIIAQTGTSLTLDAPLPTTAIAGSVVTIFRGCDHSIKTCRDKFGNVANFGSHPHLVVSNPWIAKLMKVSI